MSRSSSSSPSFRPWPRIAALHNQGSPYARGGSSPVPPQDGAVGAGVTGAFQTGATVLAKAVQRRRQCASGADEMTGISYPAQEGTTTNAAVPGVLAFRRAVACGLDRAR